MSSGPLSPSDVSGYGGVNSSPLRDPFNCHILLCFPTATNTISLNNLVFEGRNVLRSCFLIFAYQLGEFDEKNDSLYVLYFIKEEAKHSIKTVVDFYQKWACKWTELFELDIICKKLVTEKS